MLNHGLIRQSRWIVYLLHIALLSIAHVTYVRYGGNHIHIKLAVQSLLNNLHVEQAQESATETEAQSYR